MKEKICSIGNIKNDRVEFLDVAKGLGIILVVIGHVSVNNKINNWIYSFHMPLFFVISGYIAAKNNKIVSTTMFISRKIKSLLIPYFTFSILTYLYWIVIERNIRGDNTSVIEPFINIFIAQGGSDNYVFNVVMWFLPCLFVTEIIFYSIYKRNSEKSMVVLLILSSIIGYLISSYIDVRLPWCLDIMFISIVFYGIGYLVFNNKKKLSFKHSIKDNLLVAMFLLVLSMVCSSFNKRLDMNNNVLPSYFSLYISSLLGIIGIIYISKKIKLTSIKYLGKNSLVIMLIHEPIKRIMLKIIEVITSISIETLRNNIFLIIVSSFIIIIVIIPVNYIVNKYVPFIIGKKASK